MKIGVISDTHIPVRAKKIPNEILELFRGVDKILHAGDLVDITVLTILKSICSDVKAVWGNMDPPEIRNSLPQREIIDAGKYKIGLTHGSGSPAGLIEQTKGIFKNDKVDIIVFGHSHYPINEKREGIIYFNPGSPTDKIFSPYNSYGIIEINDKIETRIIRI